jgi:serine protease inhibitor
VNAPWRARDLPIATPSEQENAMCKSRIFLAAVAALIPTLSLPLVPAMAEPPVVRIEASADRIMGDEIAAAQAKLAFVLIEKIAHGPATRCRSRCIAELDTHRGDNAAVSPASLAAALGIVSLGADPAMKAAIAKVLGFTPEHASAGLSAIQDVRGKRANAGDAFRSASRIVFAPSAPPNGLLRAGLESLGIDYTIADLRDPEAVAKIDAWVREVTEGTIPEILGGPVSKSSFVALNALHFKSRWKTPFDSTRTSPSAFTAADGKSGDVAMMRLGEAAYAFRQERHGERSFVAIDLPFADARFSLVVVTTADNPAAANEFAPVAPWLAGIGFKAHVGDLALPRFSASGHQDLMPALDALGLDKARHASTALQAFAPGAALSQVVQHAMIEVDEEGAEAAAATATASARMLGGDDGIHMVVDKPFVYALRDKATGLILIAGYVGQLPKAKAA